MKLKDLKQGMVCELRNGEEIIIIGNGDYVRQFNNLVVSLEVFTESLKHNGVSDFDIIKVSYGDKVLFERKESNLFFEPKKNEYYYYIADEKVHKYKNDMKYDDAIIKTNIVYKTKEEAVLELLRRQAKVRVIKEIARLNQGWDVKEHWGNNLIVKYFIDFYYRRSELVVNSSFNFKSLDNNLYLKTRELGKQLIETHSDDLKLMLEVEK